MLTFPPTKAVPNLPNVFNQYGTVREQIGDSE